MNPNPGDKVLIKSRVAVEGIIVQSPATLYFVEQTTAVDFLVSLTPYPFLHKDQQFYINLYDIKYILSQVDNSIVYDGTVDA